MKVMLILVDGMRPDAMVQFPQAQALMQSSASTLDAQTVFPSAHVTSDEKQPHHTH